ncbi:dihydroxyacetone phosphate acyltransferase [Choristoneura fumiferana]|uniref:dihydroxyacetone phosphate acyltransferase n=1 Tax=Choristoneura fumiferana TaxID=7141 RepID=UPI003D1542C5
MSENVNFKDILLPRKTESGIFRFMSRAWYPQRTLTLDKYLSPQDLRDAAANSVFLDSVIETESLRTGVSKEKLKEEVRQYLEEMGLEKKLHVIRWMGVVFLKIAFMMKIGIYVNEPAVLKVRESMGKNPVLFLPTHRSYADFCVMTYLCYHYDIDFPAVAAGMDFYSMAVVGRRMRETCAFYIRRTLAGAPLYAATLRQYVRTLVAKHCSPIEFFLEGTRSRSNKSLPPKYGMLSMSLAPWFSRDVSDITVVPINISYDRLMEQSLFAYEHLGVPKPKESTGGLLKALHRLNDNFGNIYINLGAPLSVREYLNNAASDNTERLKPVDLQQLTQAQFQNVQDIANYVITLQQRNTVATISNLLALVLMQSLMNGTALELNEVLKQVEWMVVVLRALGASVFENDVSSSVARVLVIHDKMMRLDRKNRLRLLSIEVVDVSVEVKKKMKGHILKAETMANAVPIIQLQLYVNPMLHYLVPPAVLAVIVTRAPLAREQLVADYNCIRKLLRHEFFHLERAEEKNFADSLEYCLQNKVIVTDGDTFVPGSDDKVSYLLKWAVWPALSTLLICADVMAQNPRCTHKLALQLVQEAGEARRRHPYCLSMDAAGNCLAGLALAGALVRDKSEQEQTYEIVPPVLEQCRRLVSSVLPEFNVDFTASNPVILDHKFASRL